MKKPKEYDKRNDAAWCGRYVWAALGILFIAMYPSGLKEIVESDNRAVVGIMFLMVALMNHLLYSERKRNREMWTTFAEAAKQHEDTQQELRQVSPEAAPCATPNEPSS